MNTHKLITVLLAAVGLALTVAITTTGNIPAAIATAVLTGMGTQVSVIAHRLGRQKGSPSRTPTGATGSTPLATTGPTTWPSCATGWPD
jgi:hypothetical protein